VNEPDSVICKMGPTPNNLRGFFVKFFQFHFSSAQNILDPSLTDCIWKPDTESTADTPIDITVPERIDLKKAGLRPAILVKRGRIVTTRLSIGAQLQGQGHLLFPDDPDFDPNFHPTMGERVQVVQEVVDWRVIATASTAATAEVLGLECYHATLDCRLEMLQELNLEDLWVGGASEVSKLAENPEISAVQVPIQTTSMRWTKVRQEAPLIKRIGFEIQEV
jgi:hypothetical protein